MADSSCSENNESESEDSASENENVGPLEEAAQAGADLQIPGKADISGKRKFQTNPGNRIFRILRKFSFLDNDTIINGLAEELPKYLALSDGVQVQTQDDKGKECKNSSKMGSCC